MASAAIFPVAKIIRGNMTKPRNAQFTGRYHGDQMIYSERRPIRGDEVPLLDKAGKEVQRTRNGLTRTVTHRPIVDYEIREFVIEDLGNGQTPKNYAFAPDPNEVNKARLAEAATPEKMVAFMAKMDRLMKKMGLDEQDIDALMASDEADEDDVLEEDE